MGASTIAETTPVKPDLPATGVGSRLNRSEDATLSTLMLDLQNADQTKHIVVVGMGYAGIPSAALFADVPGFQVVGVQRRSPRSGWKIEALNAGKSPFEGDEPGLSELLHRVVLDKKTLRVTDDYSVCGQAEVILGAEVPVVAGSVFG